MRTIEAVLWDMDGVLLDTERLCQQAFVDVMGPRGIMENPAERYLETIGLNFPGIVEWYAPYTTGPEQAEAFTKEVGRRYMELAETDLCLKPGVTESLQKVRDLGIPQMVVTSSKEVYANTKLNKAGITEFFNGLIAGDHVSKGKPAPEPYLTAAAHLGISVRNALVIEDSPNGVKSGLAAEAMVVHVPDLVPTDPAWEGQIHHAMASLELFPAWLIERTSD